MAATATARSVGGLTWTKDSPGPAQVTRTLTFEEAWKLRSGDRLQRIGKAAGSGVHLQLLDRASHEHRLLITGPRAEGVGAADRAVRRLLDKDAELAVAVHVEDVDELQRVRCRGIEELERRTGCFVHIAEKL